jgi:UDP-N-acetylmuramoyl-tripeptide--D-alanyl-D-alanine ligase
MASRTDARVVTFGVDAAGADVTASAVAIDDELRPSFRLDSPWGGADIRLAARGAHQVSNALAAAAGAMAAGAAPDDVATGLAAATVSPWRMELRRTAAGAVVLNDAYNANPTSMNAALRALAQTGTAGRRIAILGDMLELGRYADDAHAEIGRDASQLGIDVVIGVGPGGNQIAAAATGAHVFTADDTSGALQIAIDSVEPGDAVLVKASHAVGLETVAEGLLHHLDAHRGVAS